MSGEQNITGIVVIIQKDVHGNSLPEHSVSLHLISATQTDGKGRGRVGDPAYIDTLISDLPGKGKESAYRVSFPYDSSFGIPGAFYINNFTQTEFLLVSFTLDDIPNHGTIRFVCNSWIYNAKIYGSTKRIFFANDAFLPSETPPALVYYRQQELETLRGKGKEKGERKKWERIYDYDVYNDLGDPDKDASLARPVLGGSTTYPYPRRGRTGRPPTKTDPKTESRSVDLFYVPRDEAFAPVNFSPGGSLAHVLKSISEDVIPELHSVFDTNSELEFDSFNDVYDLYEKGIKLPTHVLSKFSQLPVVNQIFLTDGDQVKPPTPKVIQVSKSAWMTDEEFAREIIAGVNPALIRCLQVFPPQSTLSSGVYGTSKITKEHLEPNLLDDKLTVDQAIQSKRLFILDHHDSIFPYLRRINSIPTVKAYASRTIFFLKNDGTLKPLVIELSLPDPDGDDYEPVSNVYLPATEGVESSIWLLAKAYVIVNDSCFHQLISHWLHTHAVVEPFVIATNRQLSVVHPIYKLLHPHYRNTMNINAQARKILINAAGIIESTFLAGKYAMEFSSSIYKDWVFPDQALPADLIKRGVAVKDSTSPHGVRLVIKDYPYAVDGLDIWGAIKTWVQEYVHLYYPSNYAVHKDIELQAWWKEVVEVGHGDLKHKPWWPKMQSRDELIESCTTLIWTASALHASVNFGQYPYGGVILNRPTLSRRLMPEEGTEDYEDLEKNTQKAYLMTITPKPLAMLDLAVMEALSNHASDEFYLGDRESAEYWTSDTNALAIFNKFGKTLKSIEEQITLRNEDGFLKNRVGPVKMPYTLLFPTSEPGITFKGIPNSISI